MRRTTVYLALPLALAALACGDAIDPVTGGEGRGGEGFAVLVTDAEDDATLIGSMTGSLRVALRNDAGGLVDLGVANDVEIALHEAADSIALTGLTRPPADDYVGVQLRFEGVDVDVLSGSVVGDSTLTQNFTLDVGSGGSATVEILVPEFTVDNASVFDIVVDLNSETWVTGANLDDLGVSQADLANSVTVDVL